MILFNVERLLLIIVLCVLVLLTCFVIFISIFMKLSSKVLTKKGDSTKEHYDELNLNANKGEIVFLGDSLTEFYDTDEFFHGINLYNRGIAGDTTDGVLKRLHSNVINLQPSKVFLQVGTNDLGYKKSVDYIVNNIQTIIEEIQKYTKTKIYFISLYPVNDHAYPYSKMMVKPRKNNDIVAINEKMKEYCMIHEIDYIDVHSHLVDNSGCLRKDYTIEGLHITFEGYLEITKIITDYI